MHIHIWTRVHVMPNPGKAGIGIVFEAHKDGVLVGEREIGRSFTKLTNYQADIEAVSIAILTLDKPSVVTVHSASQPFVLSASKYPDWQAINAEQTAFKALFDSITLWEHTVNFVFEKANSHENFDLAKMLAIQQHKGRS